METIETIFETLKKDNFWPGDLEQAYEVLLNSRDNLEISSLICPTEENIELCDKVKDWEISRVVKGALFCFFVSEFEASKGLEQKFFSKYLWKEFFRVSIYPRYDIDFLIFARDLNFFKNSPIVSIIEGLFEAIFYYNCVPFFKRFKKKQDLKNIENILYLLNVEESDITFLVNQTFETKSFKVLLDFLETNKKDFSINEVFLLEKVLLPFSVLQKNKEILAFLEQIYADFLEEKKIELETFNIFDIFLSGEETKGKLDVLSFFNLHQSFFLEIYKQKESCLKLFLLFEEYLVLEKKADTSVGNLTKKELFFHIETFCIAKKNLLFQDDFIDLLFDLGQKWEINNNFILHFNKIVGLIIMFVLFSLWKPPIAQAVEYGKKFDLQPNIVTTAISRNDIMSQSKKEVTPQKLNQKIISKKTKTVEKTTEISQKSVEISQKSVKKYDAFLYSKGFKNNVFQINNDKSTTIYNSLVSYDKANFYKKNLYKILEKPHPAIEFDHILNKPFCQATGLEYKNGLTVARPPALHKFLTKRDVLKKPPTCGYGPDRDNILHWVRSFFALKTRNIKIFYETHDNLENFPSLEQTLNATKTGMAYEFKRLQNTIKHPENVLAVNDFITFCQQATSEVKRFQKDIKSKLDSGVNISEIIDEFEYRIPECGKLYGFHSFLYKNVPINSFEYFAINQELDMFNQPLKQNVDCLAFFKGNMTERDQALFLKPAFSPATSWEELETLSDKEFGFENRTKGLRKPIFYRSNLNQYNKSLGVLEETPVLFDDPNFYL